MRSFPYRKKSDLHGEVPKWFISERLRLATERQQRNREDQQRNREDQQREQREREMREEMERDEAMLEARESGDPWAGYR